MTGTLARIEAVDVQGRGHCTVDGRRLRVLDVDEGEEVLVDLRDEPLPPRGGPRVVLTRAVRTPSPWRQPPGCDQYRGCPGCVLRHLRYERQLQLKDAALRRALDAVGLLGPLAPGPPVPCGGACRGGEAALLAGQRTRAQLTDLSLLAGPRLGMLARSGSDVEAVDLTRCPAHAPGVNQLLAATQRELGALGVQPYHPVERTGLVRFVAVDLGAQGRARVVVSTVGADLVDLHPEAMDLLEQHAGVCLMTEQLPRRGDQHLRRGRARVLRGDPRLEVRAGSQLLSAGPGAWTPVSPGAEAALSLALAPLLQAASEGRLLEVGCGVGGHTLEHGRRFEDGALGIDASRAAVEDAEANARRLGLDHHVRFRQGWAHKVLRRLVAAHQRFHTVLLHGMRSPFGPAVADLLALLGASRLICVSPSPRSLAADLRSLSDRGWQLRSVRAVDQLPGTGHVMGVAALHRP